MKSYCLWVEKIIFFEMINNEYLKVVYLNIFNNEYKVFPTIELVKNFIPIYREQLIEKLLND